LVVDADADALRSRRFFFQKSHADLALATRTRRGRRAPEAPRRRKRLRTQRARLEA